MLTLLTEGERLVAGGELRLSEDQANHLRVRRLGAGARVRLTDGRGALADGEVLSGVLVRIVEAWHEPAPAPLTLAVGAGDRDRFGWLAEKATELGVTTLMPVDTERSASVAGRIRASHVRKLSIRAREAVKQCGAAWAAVVVEPMSLVGFIGAASGIRWLAHADGAPPPALAAGEGVTVAVGPEGGFTEGEVAAMIGAGFLPVRLGGRTLRFESAALAAAAVVGVERLRGMPPREG